ncbi:MAG TPA: riboflavin synthase [Gemmatimonadaceae bacterium]|nr:riboflavin synthase [Gemmatimonadaceae bacterium]
MFTGLIDDVGRIDAVAETEAGRELRIACRSEDLAPGESVSVNGACLTVRDCGPRWFTAAAVETTLGRTTIGTWAVGTLVNLERAVMVGTRLGGHLVQGHVDGVAKVQDVTRVGDTVLVDLALPAALVELCVLHGSIAVDGVSLTINAVPRAGVVQLALIDYTLRHTTLGSLGKGDAAHVEVDVIGKYVQQWIAPYRAALHGRAIA